MTAETVRTLEALRTRCEQDEQRAEKVLVDSTRRAEAARNAVAAIEAAERAAHTAWHDTRERTRTAGGTVQALRELNVFLAHLRVEHDTAQATTAEAKRLLVEAETKLAAARVSLGEARGKREAVEKRIAEQRAALERKVEARTEDDAADAAAGRHLRG